MRKGDAGKKRIMDAAEKLFGEKGYIGTSVQDILNELHMSKGGFYHYFDAKLDLLNEICERSADTYLNYGVDRVRGMNADPVEKLNAALKLISAIDRETPSLFKAVTSLSLTGGDAMIKRSRRDIAAKALIPLMTEILAQGAAQGQFNVKKPVETARILTLLALDINEEATRDIINGYANPDSAIDILDLLTAYREAVEKLVNAPYGSIELFDMSEMLTSIGGMVNSLKG